MDFVNMMLAGGPVMWLLLLGGAAALTLFLYKTFQFHRDEVNVRELITGLVNVLDRNGYVEAVTLCDNTPGPAARVLASAILAAQRGDGDIGRAVEDAGLDEIPKLESMLSLIEAIGYLAPLLGLLGTVLGMMTAFTQLGGAQNSIISQDKLMPGVTMSLLTTAAGLTLAIFCYAAYTYLFTRVRHLVLDMEKGASEMLAYLERRRNEK